MFKGKRKHSTEFKLKIALTALKGEITQSELCSMYEVHVTQINRWKKQAVEFIRSGFTSGQKKGNDSKENKLQDELYKQIGQLKVELDWIKKKVGFIDCS